MGRDEKSSFPDLKTNTATIATATEFLIILCGLPGAGKSYFAHRILDNLKQINPNTIILDTDEMREVLFGNGNEFIPENEKKVRDILNYRKGVSRRLRLKLDHVSGVERLTPPAEHVCQQVNSLRACAVAWPERLHTEFAEPLYSLDEPLVVRVY